MTRAGAILIQKNLVALIERQRDDERYLVFPGGQVEEGETLQGAVCRELMEELGITVAVGPQVVELHFRGNTQHYFLATITGGTFGTGTGPEMAGDYPPERGTYRPRWLPIAELQTEPVRPQILAAFVKECLETAWPDEPRRLIDAGPMSHPATARSLDVSGLLPEAQPIAAQAAAIYLKHTAPWFVGLIAHGSAVKGGFIPNCSDIDFQLYLQEDAFAADGELPLALGIAIHRELAAIDHRPFRYIQCYAMGTQLRHGWIGPIPGTYHLIAGKLAVPPATAEALRTNARHDLAALKLDSINLLSSGGGRLERHVRLLCTKVWPVLYQLVALQEDDPIGVWNLPKPAVIALLAPTSEGGLTIRAYDRALRRYYPDETSTSDGLHVLETGMAFLRVVTQAFTAL